MERKGAVFFSFLFFPFFLIFNFCRGGGIGGGFVSLYDKERLGWLEVTYNYN